MLTRRNLLSLALAAFAALLVAGETSSLLAQGGGGNNGIRLIANMSAGATKGKAKYEQRGNRRKFSYELQNGVPGSVVSVRRAGSVVGTFTVDAFGRGKFELDTNLGQSVSIMAAGDVIEAWLGENPLMSDSLQPAR